MWGKCQSTSWWVWLIFGPKDTQISHTSSSWFWIQKLARPLNQERTGPPDKVQSSSRNLTTVAGSIFGPLSLTHFSKSESFYWKLIVGVAFGMSFHLNLKSQSPWSLFNGTWQKRIRKLDYRLRFEIKEITLQIWLKETPLPGGVSYWLCSLIKNLGPPEGFVPGSSRGVLLHTVLDEET